MAELSVVFKRTKSKPVPRARERSPDGTDAAEISAANITTGAEDSPSTLATKLKNKAKRSKPKARLSFGGDNEEEEGEAFKLKKSNLSRKVALGTHPSSTILPQTLDQASISSRMNAGPSYDAASLSALKASTPSSRPRLPENESYDADVSMDIDDASFHIEDPFVNTETAIPSQASIVNAKEKRERLRVTGPSEDYISLSVTRRADEPAGPHPESRLMREEDELGEGEDEFADYTSAQERIALGKKARKAEAGKRKTEMQEMIKDAEEEDDETVEWEREQLRRGGHTAADFQDQPVKQVYKPAPIPPSTAVPVLSEAVSRVSKSLTALTASHAQHTSSMSALADEHVQVEQRVTEMREMINAAEDKRSWFVAFREWIETVATFLDEKFPKLEKLEEEHISILTERWDMVEARRKGDDEDDLSIMLGTVTLPRDEPPEVDELGRVVPSANPLVGRRERRAARMQRRSKRKSQTDVEEGYSTDSSLPSSDASDFKTAIRHIGDDSRDILSDVRAADFKNPQIGLAKWFSEWRERFSEEYTRAWGGLGLVLAWVFWVRLETVDWNPLEDPRTLDSFNWYSSLYGYSRPGSTAEGTLDEATLGPDGDLVSSMITTAVIPRLCKLIGAGAFDPYSARSTRMVIDLTEQVEASIDEDHAKLQDMQKNVVAVFQRAADASAISLQPFLNLNRPAFDPEAISARRRYLVRRAKLLQNLVKWRKSIGKRFGMAQLVASIVDRIILPVARTGWEVGGGEIVMKIRESLPNDLVPASISRL